MKKKNGFTLIELLAVIVILAIIALIAVPVIMNVLSKANKSAFKDTAYGIISAGELYFAEQQLELNGMSKDKTFTFPTEDIEIKGDVPAGTILKVNTRGETALAMSNGRYCVTKGYTDKDITLTEEFTDCKLPSATLSDLATTNSEVTSIASCLNDGTECEAGTAFVIKVNDTDTYKFRVLKDENNTVTLIMSSNLYAEGNTTEPDVAWYDKEDGCWSDDYVAFGWMGCSNSYGPLTVLEALKTRTSSWTNITEYSYELNYGPVYEYDDEGDLNEVPDKGTYSGEYVQNVRARLPRLSDIVNDTVGCTEWDATCPEWMFEGLYETGDDNTRGYWLSDALSGNTSMAWVVGYNLVYGDYNVYESYGVRPVITLTK